LASGKGFLPSDNTLANLHQPSVKFRMKKDHTGGRSIVSLPRNVWAVSLTSFLMDISSEMVLKTLPLFLTNVLGVRIVLVGVIEGTAETTSSLLKIFSGWLSDYLRQRKWLAVAGYTLSAISRPLFYVATSWSWIAGGRWIDRVGKGIRTAPRDALVADSISSSRRGLAFGFHRAADTAGATLGIAVALAIVLFLQDDTTYLTDNVFRTIVLVSLIPAFLAVVSLIVAAKDVNITSHTEMPKFSLSSLGRPFTVFICIVGFFELGNSSDAFLILLAQKRGLSLTGILGMLLTFNLVYTVVSMPAGSLSDRIDRRKIIVIGWLVYAFIYLGFALSRTGAQIWVLYGLYGIYYGMAYGTSKAIIADIVPAESRGTAYGVYSAVLGLLNLPSSVIAGLLWEGASTWEGFGPSAPFVWGATLAFVSAIMMAFWRPGNSSH
jgi:MFS family permease